MTYMISIFNDDNYCMDEQLAYGCLGDACEKAKKILSTNNLKRATIHRVYHDSCMIFEKEVTI